MVTAKEKLAEIIEAEKFLTVIKDDPRVSPLVEELQYALACDRQDIRSSLKLISVDNSNQFM